MNKRQAAGYRNLTHYMIGKVDRAGRLLDETTKRALAEARHLQQLRQFPRHPEWVRLTNQLDDQIRAIIGVDAFFAWGDSINYENLTPMDEYNLSRAKLAEVQAIADHVHNTIIASTSSLVQK